jgi:hypothetical protein
MVEKLQQHYFVENVGLVCLLLLFKFLSSMVEELQQPYFIESVGNVGENATSTTPN